MSEDEEKTWKETLQTCNEEMTSSFLSFVAKQKKKKVSDYPLAKCHTFGSLETNY